MHDLLDPYLQGTIEDADVRLPQTYRACFSALNSQHLEDYAIKRECGGLAQGYEVQLNAIVARCYAIQKNRWERAELHLQKALQRMSGSVFYDSKKKAEIPSILIRELIHEWLMVVEYKLGKKSSAYIRSSRAGHNGRMLEIRMLISEGETTEGIKQLFKVDKNKLTKRNRQAYELLLKSNVLPRSFAIGGQDLLV